MGTFCRHQWECDPQGHYDGYRRSVVCTICGTLSRVAEAECVCNPPTPPERD